MHRGVAAPMGNNDPVHVVARTVAAVAGFEWSWAADQLEEFATAAGWIYRPPSEGTVSCAFDAAPGRAGAFLFGAEVTAVYLNLSESDGLDVPGRRDLFVAAIAEVGAQLGPPPIRCPGPDPSVGWRVAAGVLEIVDRPGMLDLWLRPAPRRVPSPAVPPFTGEVGWAALGTGLAAAAASLPAGAGVRLERSRRPAGTNEADRTSRQPPRKQNEADRTSRQPAGEEEEAGRTSQQRAGGGGKDDERRSHAGEETLAELFQTEDSLTVRVGDGTETVRWPAAGTAYHMIAGRLVARLREEAASPADLAYRSDLPVPHLPLRREMRHT
ncbi:hypothetical protein Aph02nite_21310 [Actinoplanes philippinensis]|uniref:Uncharacterized protein n=1 Tax=Actinoplanes philippinensis TaxID=35752 RepID=A0A1I2BYL3_9ACTN|nr:DUF6301 family protein [Actinoplanes philippinensis]GIE76181.1 hypothetical protein Aph02nite_21310 [Actinoplanes philippinensis]SFE61055.1 hypothetical protein SAMN05421541_102597 [Actinoplanes philippinensis]